jgi:hypothetical protein
MDFYDIQREAMAVEKIAILLMEMFEKVVNRLLSISCHILC